MMKRFVRLTALCLLALIISMSFLFILPLETQAATNNPNTIYWYYSSGVLRIGDESEDVRTDYYNDTGYYYISPSSYDTASGNAVPWAADTYKNGVTTVKFVGSSSGNKIRPATTREWFKDFTKLTTVEGFDNLELQGTMDRMFYKCTGLVLTADNMTELSQLDTGNVTNMNRMFYGASIDDSENNLSKLLQWRNECGVPERFTKDDATFKEYIGFGGETLAGKMWWGYDQNAKIYYFGTEESVKKQPGIRKDSYRSGSANSLNFKSQATSVVILGDDKIYLGSGFNLFNGLSGVKKIEGFEKLDTSHLTTMEQMFYGCNSLEELDVSGFNTSSVTSMKSAFSGCSSLTEIDVTGFVTSNVTDLSYMFSDCSSLGRPAVENDDSTSVPLDVTGFVTSNVTKIEGMFRQCGNLRWINGVKDWDVSSVCTMYELFCDCKNLKELDVSEWDTRSAGTSGNKASFNNMFANILHLKELDLSGFIIDEKVSGSSEMISGTPAEKITLPNFFSTMQLNLAYGHTYWDTNTKEDVSGAVESGRDQHVLLLHDKHKLETIPAVAPTCEKDGALEYYQCTICGHYFAGENFWDDKAGLYQTENIWDAEAKLYQNEVLKAPVDPATGHTPGDWITDIEPTCTSLGTKHKECTVCGKSIETGTIDATGHSESVEWEVYIEAKCTSPGSRIKKCTVCSTDDEPTILKMEIIPATGHVMKEGYETIKAPTCTVNGVGNGVCDNCGTHLEYFEIPATGHSMSDEYETLTYPTCTENGIGKGSCENCDYIGLFEIPATGHTWDDKYTVDVEPTCTTDGSKSIHCKNKDCDATKDSEVLPATGHTSSEDWIVNDHERWQICTVCGEKINIISHTYGDLQIDKAPTCTEDGLGHRNCTGCGYEEEEVIKALGHSWNEDYTVDVEATCTAQGSKSIHCKNCDEVKSVEPIPAHDHSWDDDYTVDVEATCTTDGSKSIHCKNCDAVKSVEPITAPGHAWKDDQIDKAPTCIATGIGHRECAVCGHIDIFEIPLADHTWPDDDVWESDGDARWKACTVCGAELERIEHTFGEWDIEKAPTCTETGIRYRECVGCGYREEEVIEAAGHTPSEDWIANDHERLKVCTVCGIELDRVSHTFGDLQIDKAPTCTEDGIGHRNCTGCGYEETEVIKATGHSWDEDYTVDAEPTCTAQGSKSIHCKNCDAVKSVEPIPANDHSWDDDYTVDAEPTCTTDGSKSIHCKNCDAVKSVESITAPGHTWKDEQITDKSPTCTSTGIGHKECAVCGYIEIFEIEANGHSWDEDYTVDVEPTCTAQGSKSIHCKNCDATTDSKPISKIEHAYGETMTRPVTCEIDGYTYHICSVCGHTEKIEDFEATGHNKSDWIIDADSDCITAGSQHKECTVCGKLMEREAIDAKGHSFGEWEKANDKQHKRICNCGVVEYADHDWNEWQTYDGESHAHVCSVCGEIGLSAHVWDDGEIITAATHLTEGEIKYTCHVCGETKTEVIPKTPEHTFGAWEKHDETQYKRTCECGEVEYDEHAWHDGEIITPATHLKEGEIKYTCHICGAEKTEVIPKTTEHTFGEWEDAGETQHKRTCACGEVEYQEHAWDNGEIITEATHLTEGERRYTCQICGATKTEVISKTTEHTFGAWEDAGETQHKRTCECGAEEYQAHAWSKWHIHDENSRERECLICGREEISIHTWNNNGEGRVIKEATCNETGVKIYTCTTCDATKMEILPIKDEHTYGETMTRPVTCEIDGYTYHTCTVCGHTEKIEDFEATGHNASDWIVDAEADCVTSGSRHKECTVCGKLLETEVIDAKGHSFGDWEKHDGAQHKHICKCGVVEYADHSWDEWQTHDGESHAHVCSVCGEIGLSAHVWDEGEIITAATHLTEGEIKYTCHVCGETKTEVIPKTTEHTFGDWEKHDGAQHKRTCACGTVEYEDHAWGECTKVDGNTHKHICTICGAEKTEDHGWGEPVIVPATHLADGSEIYFCQSCGATKTKVIPKTTEHTFGAWEKHDGAQHKRTCACGEVEYQDHAWGDWEMHDDSRERVCSVCGEVDISIHTWDDGEIITEATHLTEGEIKYTCKGCGATKTEVIPKTTEHTFGEWADAGETQHKRTCECGEVEYQEHAWSKWHIHDNDSRERECVLCGREEISIHVWDNDGEGVITKQPTCNETGVKIYTCTTCGTTKTEILPITNEHTYGETMTRPVTCEIDGYTYHICSVCGHTEKIEDFEATGHNASEWITDAEADCVTTGSRHKECTVCGKLLETEVIAAKGHTPSGTWETNANEHWKTCTVCSAVLEKTPHAFGDWEQHDGTQHKRTCTCGTVEYQEHAWDDGEIITAATHLTEGEIKYTCTGCGTTKMEVIPKTPEHTFGAWDKYDGAQHKRTCACGEVEYQEHAWDNGEIIAEATHLTEGEIRYTCTGCGVTKIEVIPKTPEHTFGAWEKHDETQYKRTCECGAVEYEHHAWDDGEIITEATHLTEGEIKYTCTGCGATKTGVIPKTTEHTFGAWEDAGETQHKRTCECGAVEYEYHAWDDGEITTDATHLTEGEIKHTCTGCGATKTEIIPKTTEHTFGAWEDAGETQHKRTCECGAVEYEHHEWDDGEITTDATHLTEGEIKYTCHVCGATKTQVIPKTTEHTFGDWEDAGETQHKRTCECGEVEYQDHAWNNGEIITDATHLTEGEKKYTCHVCGGAKTEVIPKTTEHTFGEWADAGETQHKRTCACGEVEYQEHAWSKWHIHDNDSRERECLLCGREEISIHIWDNDGEGKVIKEATCNETGVKIYTCTTCGTTKTEILPITNEHTYGETMTRPVTCEIDGYTYHICSVCGHTEKIEDFKATGHNASDWIVDAEADCVTAGSRHKECTVCGKILETEIIEATGHTYGETMIRPATCEIAGYTYHTCTVCGHTEKIKDFEAMGHKESEWIDDAEADCVTAGSRHKECTVCGKLLESEVIAAKGHTPSDKWETDNHERWKVCTVCGAVVERIPHTFGALIIDTAPTCAKPGSGHRICLGCGHTEIFEIAATEHSWESDYTVDKEPTCTTDGSKSIHCERCGEVKDREIIPATGHTESDWSVDAEAGCITAGSRHKECTVCGKLLKTEAIAAKGHNYGDIIIYDATCATAGYTYHICTVCGFAEKVDDIEAKGHTESEWIVDAEAGCITAGSRHKECTVCGKLLKTEVIAAKGHTYGDSITYDATCEIAGCTYHICTVCGHTEKVDDIAAKGHTESDWIVDIEADCVTAGSRHEECETCGKLLETEVIEATGHTYGETIIKKATCEEAGYTYHICTVCGFTEKVDDIAATGHTESDWIVDAEADCVTAGSRHEECETCGKLLETEVIEATGHTYGETVIKEATCEETGYTYHICTVCGFTEKVDDIAATGHTESDWIVDAEADCVTTGRRHKECTVCGKHLETEVIEATGHTPSDTWKPNANEHWKTCTVCGAELEKSTHSFEWVIDKEATATEKGSKHEKCTVCGYEKSAIEIPTTDIPAIEIPVTGLDNTGDSNNMWLWFIMLIVSAASLTDTVYSRKKKFYY